MQSNKLIDEIGKRYGPWLVIRRIEPNYRPEKPSMARWECRCIHCDAKKIYIGNHLRSGHYAHTCRECGGS